ncbi:MAG TPA: hypothetical protein DDZ81_17520 [Acetobacteraceae bacterium]|jgi:hypothetical protein|nr:hypothetical protein [Acetobacteraceae bacterium]
MLSAEREPPRLVAWSGDVYRLIPSRFPPVSVYEGLVANDRLSALVAVENLTNPRLRAESRLTEVVGTGPSADVRLQNWNLAPFAYGNPDGSTFFDERRPCLEVADDRQTALAISVTRRQAFLESTSEAPIGLDMRMFTTPIRGRFWDLRCHPPGLERKRRRELGATMPSEADGILYHPPERPTSTCLAIVKGEVLGRTLQSAHYRYMWNGSRISMLYAFDADGRQIEPAALSGEANVLAA